VSHLQVFLSALNRRELCASRSISQVDRLSDVVTTGSFAASKAAANFQQRLHRQGIVRRPLGGIKRHGPNPAFGAAHCVVR
jgi:hypothetical protein